MFHLAHNLYSYCRHRSEVPLHFVVIGLPNGGKSTLKQVLGGDLHPVAVPTIGTTKPLTLKVRAPRASPFPVSRPVSRPTPLRRLRFLRPALPRAPLSRAPSGIHGSRWVEPRADDESCAPSPGRRK